MLTLQTHGVRLDPGKYQSQTFPVCSVHREGEGASERCQADLSPLFAGSLASVYESYGRADHLFGVVGADW